MSENSSTNGSGGRIDISSIPGPRTPNPLLFQLDNKKKAVLAHEVDEGAKCTVCGDKCPGLDLHFWRKVCKACKCPKDTHEHVGGNQEDPGLYRIGRLFDLPLRSKTDEAKYTVSNNVPTPEREQAPVGFDDPLRSKFEWIPPNVTSSLVQRYMELLPEEKRPEFGKTGFTWRRKALDYQLPMHDIEPSACDNTLSQEEKTKMEKYISFYKKSSVGQATVKERTKESQESGDTKWTCRGCEKGMYVGEIAVYAEKAGPKEAYWHPGCFKCHKCTELLVDLIYFYKDENIYCGRHFGESMFPRCAGCDELIFAREFTQAEGQSFHKHHFCCFQCDTELGGHRYMHKNNKQYCLQCYKVLYAKVCSFCTEKIDADVERISHGDFHWHATEQCFHCDYCKKSLLNGRFLVKNSRLFCCNECKRSAMS